MNAARSVRTASRLALDTLRHPLFDPTVATLSFAFSINLFWYYESPFRPHRTVRHRTEYYDTQCLLCGMLYHAMYEQLRPPGREAAGAGEL